MHVFFHSSSPFKEMRNVVRFYNRRDSLADAQALRDFFQCHPGGIKEYSHWPNSERETVLFYHHSMRTALFKIIQSVSDRKHCFHICSVWINPISFTGILEKNSAWINKLFCLTKKLDNSTSRNKTGKNWSKIMFPE